MKKRLFFFSDPNKKMDLTPLPVEMMQEVFSFVPNKHLLNKTFYHACPCGIHAVGTEMRRLCLMLKKAKDRHRALLRAHEEDIEEGNMGAFQECIESQHHLSELRAEVRWMNKQYTRLRGIHRKHG